MNILFYLSNSSYSNKPVGGAEVSLELLAKNLAQKGENVYFVTLLQSNRFALEKKVVSSLKIYFIHYIADLKEELVTDKARQFIAEIVRHENIQIINSYEIKDTFEILKIKEFNNFNVKIVKRVAGLYWAHRIDIGKITKNTAEWVFNSVDALNYLTPSSKKLVEETSKKYSLRISPKKDFILDIGIDLGLFKYHWKPKVNRPFRIICVAKFETYQKDQALLIRALSRIDKDILVDFIGTGQSLKECQELCLKLGLNRKVVFHDYIDQRSIVKKLAAADLFVLPTKFEGLPKSMLEAMAVGTPCLVSNVSPLDQIIVEGETGFLTLNTEKEWSAKIDWLYDNRQILKKVSYNSRLWVEKNYSSADNALKYKAIFESLLVDPKNSSKRILPETNDFDEKITPRVAIVWPQKGYPGRSFVEAHTELLRGIECRLYTQWNPYFFSHDLFPSFMDGKPLFSSLQNFQHQLKILFFRKPMEDFRNSTLAKILLKEKINAVLVEFGQTAVTIMDACQKAGIPLVVHFHGADAYNRNLLKKHESNYKKLFLIGSSFIAVSNDMKDQLIKLGAPADKVFCNPCGVNVSIFKDATPHLNPPVFLGVARFVEKKGHFVTILAFQKVLKECPEATLIFLGDGELLENCKSLCKLLKLDKSVHFMGKIFHEEVSQWMQKSRALVQHSIVASDGNSEGTPVSVLEAGACGLPVVATFHKGITEAIIHEKTGFLVTEGDVDAMAHYMLKLAQDPSLAATMGTNARQWISDNYSQEKSLHNLYKILSNAVNHK